MRAGRDGQGSPSFPGGRVPAPPPLPTPTRELPEGEAERMRRLPALLLRPAPGGVIPEKAGAVAFIVRFIF